MDAILSPERKAGYVLNLMKLWGKEVLPSFEARILEPLAKWAPQHFKLTKATGGTGQFIPYPYQEGIMLMMTMPGLEKLCVFKSAQIGYTQMLLCWYFYETTHRSRSTILYQPTDSDAKDFTTSTMDEALAICPTIAAEMVVVQDGGKVDKKDSANTVHKKVFRNAIGYVLGAKAANAFRRRSAPSLGLDEADAMDVDVEGEGRPDKLAASRSAGVSSAIKMIIGSTPTVAGSSLIEVISNEIPVKLRRYYPCPYCGHKQWLSFGGRDDPFGIKWDNKKGTNIEKARSCYYECQGGCGKPIRYSDMPKMDKEAVWQDPDTGIYLDTDDQCFRDMKTDDVVETPFHAVAYMNSLMSYTFEWWRTTLQFLDAIDALKNGDVGPLMTWQNHCAGELFYDKGEKSIKKSTLLERASRETYSANALPAQVETIVIGCDVQDDRIEYGIYGFGFGEEAWCIEYHRVMGNPATTRVLEVLREDANRKFMTTDGKALGVELVCVDSGHLSQTVYDFCSHEPHKFIPIKGSNQIGDADVLWPTKPTEGTYRVRLGTQSLKDTIATRCTFEEVGAGYQHWRNDEDMFGEKYFHGFTAESRKLRRVQGKPVRMWMCPSGRANEPWDVHVYALAAVRILQRHYGFRFSLPSAEDQQSRIENVDRAPVQHANLITPNQMDLEAVLNRMAGG